jgi:uncharacterized protein (TIGR01244 family)
MKRLSLSPGLALATMFLAVLAFGATCADIEKFNWIDERIATGGQPRIEEFAALKREGFRTILNLREATEYDAAAEAAEVHRLGMRYISIPVRTAEPKDDQVDAFLTVLADRKILPAFVHCGSANRVGAFWMISRVLVDGWTIEDAERDARMVGMKSANLREFAYEYICRHQKAESRAVPCANRGSGAESHRASTH